MEEKFWKWNPSDRCQLVRGAETFIRPILIVALKYAHMSVSAIVLQDWKSRIWKYLHQFQDVTTVIFVADLSIYAKMPNLKSDDFFGDQLSFFEYIVNSRWFAYTSVLLFFNKTDVFKERIQRKNYIKDHFPDFSGTFH